MRIWIFTLAVLSLMSAWTKADDLDALVAQTKPPQRFAGHTPNLQYREMTFPMNEIDADAWKAGGYQTQPAPTKVVQQRFGVITDGDRYVALYHPGMGQLDFITFDPTRTPATLNMPPRYHWGSMFGTRIQTVPWAYGWAPTGDTRETKWTGGGKELQLIETQSWKNKKDGSPKARSTHAVTIKLDAALGYVVEIDARFATREANKRNSELANIVPKGLSDPYSPQFDRLVFSEAGGSGYVGWNNNCFIGEYTNRHHPIKLRDGGLLAWLRGEREADRWGVAVTRTNLDPARAVKFTNPTCNVWLDQHNSVELADQRDAEGFYTAHVLFRVTAIPPEVAERIVADTRWEAFKGVTTVMIRMDGETFEDQPLPISSPVRGACAFGKDLKIATGEGHSGERSLQVTAIPKEKGIGKYDFFLSAPQLNLDSNARYRLSAWVKVVGDVEAFVVADLYDNSPHDDQRYRRQRTDSVSSAGEWRKVLLEFDTGPLAPQVDLRFAALGSGTAYFDDFSLTKLPAVK